MIPVKLDLAEGRPIDFVLTGTHDDLSRLVQFLNTERVGDCWYGEGFIRKLRTLLKASANRPVEPPLGDLDKVDLGPEGRQKLKKLATDLGRFPWAACDDDKHGRFVLGGAIANNAGDTLALPGGDLDGHTSRTVLEYLAAAATALPVLLLELERLENFLQKVSE